MNSTGLQVELGQAQPMRLEGAFHCGSNELLALVGPSGAGKTSVLRVLAGLMPLGGNSVRVGSEVWSAAATGHWLPPQQRHVGLVFQDYALMPHLDAVHNVALALLHLPRRERLAKARHWLSHVQLTPEQQDRRPGTLSGGQQQRVAIARALAREPSLLLLDEPFAAVDQLNRQALYRLLADLRRDLAIPIIMVTHDLNEARLLADRLVVLDAGQVLQVGTPSHIHAAPRNARVAELVGIHNHFPGVWLGPTGKPGRALLRWQLPSMATEMQPIFSVRDKGKLPPGRRVTWVLPSDGIAVTDGADAASGGFGAIVTESRFLGEITLASFALDGLPGAVIRLTLTGPQRRRLLPGDSARLQLDEDLIHVMPLRDGSRTDTIAQDTAP